MNIYLFMYYYLYITCCFSSAMQYVILYYYGSSPVYAEFNTGLQSSMQTQVIGLLLSSSSHIPTLLE